MSSLSTGDRLAGALALLLLLVLSGASTSRAGADPPALPPPPAEDAVVEPTGSIDAAVDALVADALAANLELDGASAGVAARLAALDQARARYLPTLDFSARYTRADGGRTIDFPVGDLLNPVYASLNQLTGSARFAPVAN